MAEPKKKLSKTRTHLRRSQYKISLPNVIECKNCHKPTLSHRACPSCGFYNGASVIASAPTKRISVDSEEPKA